MARRRSLRHSPRRQGSLPLRRANAMMEDGKFAEAAHLFERLSNGARRRGMPVRAANLAARASQAYLAQDRVAPALDQLRLAIRILVHRGQTQRAARLVSRATDALIESGYQAEAEELTRYADDWRQGTGTPPDEWRASLPSRPLGRRGSLPDRCAGCGAPLIADDVTWHAAETAACPYCGAIVKAV